MKSHLILTPTRGMSREQWLLFRDRGLGASEVGAVLGLDDWTSSIELFYQKIGDIPRFDVEKMANFMGRELEDLIARMWKFWDPSAVDGPATMIENWRQNKIVRRCQRVNAYVQNPAYPWLFVSLDRKIMRLDGRGEGTLELKTISRFEAEKWESGLPPKNITQVNTQMAVCEFTWGEMAQLEDGRRFEVLPFELSDIIVQHVVVKTQEFWKRVLEARKLVNEKYLPANQFNQRRLDELQAEIDKLAPEPDGTQAYADYLAVRHREPGYAERRGGPLEREEALLHKQLLDQIKELSEQKQVHENRLKLALADHEVLDFGLSGKVYWTKTETGRLFKNKIKP